MMAKRCLLVLLVVVAIGSIAAATLRSSDPKPSLHNASVKPESSLVRDASVSAAFWATAQPPIAGRAFSKQWTTCQDFSGGVSINVHCPTDSGRLERNAVADTAPLPCVWVACSGRGTVVKIDAGSGAVLGEYRTAPSTSTYPNPSRTTVDLDGDAWVANRSDDDDFGDTGSAAKFGQVIGGTRVDADGTPDPNGLYLQGPFDYCNCEDRNGDGLIYTSGGLGDIRAWDNTNEADTDGGVDNAQDECIIRYLRVVATGTRTIAVTAHNDVWIGGTGNGNHELYNGFTGAPIPGTLFNLGCGGYGGLVDCNGVLWSALYGGDLLWYDTNPSPIARECKPVSAYGLGYDPLTAYVWGTDFDGGVTKIDPLGDEYQYDPFGGSGTRGVAVDNAGDVWIANSGESSVSRLSSGGVERKRIELDPNGFEPTGVAVDAIGKVWATCMGSNTAKRIDPNGGTDQLGEVDLTVQLGAGATPYNYSDLTGMVALHTSASGTWTDVYDSEQTGARWNLVTWNTETCVPNPEPPGTSIAVGVRAANTELGLALLPYVEVQNGQPLSGCVYGRFVQVRVRLKGACPAGSNVTPVLCDVAVSGDPLLVDCNGNGTPDECEEVCLCLGDLNGDHLVNGADVQAFVCCALNVSCPEPAPNCCCGDFDHDGDVDDLDAQGFVDTLIDASSGACCMPNGSCQLMAEACCGAAGGEFAGPGTTCGTAGACCMPDGSCLLMPEVCCTQAGGTFLGEGSSCDPAGACCMPDGSCIVTSELCCSGAGGSFHGSGTTCEPTGACCMPNGSCATSTEACCLPAGGTFLGEWSSCDPVGACCMPDGSCTVMTEECCWRVAGLFAGAGTMCEPSGACCMPDGSCAVTAELCCTQIGGVFAGPGTTCELTGACCMSDGSCVVASEACCARAGGDFVGPGTMCEPIGACCLSDHSCVETTELCCTQSGGDFAGVGTWCTSTGACCLPDTTTTCAVMTLVCCQAASGSFQGWGTTCEGPQCGACCHIDTGTCGMVSGASRCAGVYDVFRAGQPCDPNTCVESRGACCDVGTNPPGTCAPDVNIAVCLGPNGNNGNDFAEGMPCLPDPFEPDCGTGACCVSATQCVDNTTEDYCLNTLHGQRWFINKLCSDPGVSCETPDFCEDALLLRGTCVTEPFDTTNATYDPNMPVAVEDPPTCLDWESPPIPMTNDYWYLYQIPTMYDGHSVDEAEVVITTLGSSFDTVLVVYAQANAAACGQPGAITCATAAEATERACNDDIVPPGLAEHAHVQLSYVRVWCDGTYGPLSGGCLLIRVGGKDVPGSAPGGVGQLNIDFIPTLVDGGMYWSNAGMCCLSAGGCVVTPDEGSCAGYWRPIADFYEGATPPEAYKASGCCHGDASSCQVGEYCAKPIELPGSNTTWSGSVWKVTYFHFTARDLVGPEESYAITIDTCGSEFDTVLSVYGYGYGFVADDVGDYGACDEANLKARNDNCTPGEVPGAVGKVSCIATNQPDSCLCLTVGPTEGPWDLMSGNEYWIAVGMKDTRSPVLRAMGVDPEPNYPINPAKELYLHLNDTHADCSPPP